MGPVFKDDSLEEAPTPLEVATMFRPVGGEANRLSPNTCTWAVPQVDTVEWYVAMEMSLLLDFMVTAVVLSFVQW